MNIPVRFQVFFPREMNYKFCFPLNNVNFCHEVVVTFMINIQTIIVRKHPEGIMNKLDSLKLVVSENKL